MKKEKKETCEENDQFFFKIIIYKIEFLFGLINLICLVKSKPNKTNKLI